MKLYVSYLLTFNFIYLGTDKTSELLNTERAYKKAPSSTLLASILKSRVRVTVMKEKSSANFAFQMGSQLIYKYGINKLIYNINDQ